MRGLDGAYCSVHATIRRKHGHPERLSLRFAAIVPWRDFVLRLISHSSGVVLLAEARQHFAVIAKLARRDTYPATWRLLNLEGAKDPVRRESPPTQDEIDTFLASLIGTILVLRHKAWLNDVQYASVQIGRAAVNAAPALRVLDASSGEKVTLKPTLAQMRKEGAEWRARLTGLAIAIDEAALLTAAVCQSQQQNVVWPLEPMRAALGLPADDKEELAVPSHARSATAAPAAPAPKTPPTPTPAPSNDDTAARIQSNLARLRAGKPIEGTQS
jgi:hypothetical protein